MGHDYKTMTTKCVRDVLVRKLNMGTWGKCSSCWLGRPPRQQCKLAYVDPMSGLSSRRWANDSPNFIADRTIFELSQYCSPLEVTRCGRLVILENLLKNVTHPDSNIGWPNVGTVVPTLVQLTLLSGHHTDPPGKTIWVDFFLILRGFCCVHTRKYNVIFSVFYLFI